MRKMSQTNNQTKRVTDEEIDRIDNILNQLDELIKQLPEDYQQDFAYETLDRLGVEEE